MKNVESLGEAVRFQKKNLKPHLTKKSVFSAKYAKTYK